MNEQNTQSPAGYEKNNYAWFILAINALAFGLTVGPMMQTGQFIPHMVKDFNASTGEVSLMMSLMALGGMVATPVAGQVFQKVPFKPYYAACMAVLTLSRAAFGISTALWQIWALSFIGGVASGLSIQIVSPIIVGNWFKEKGGTALGLSVSASAIGGAVMGPPVAAMIASLGWRRSALLLYSVTGAIVVTLVLLFLVRSPAEKGMRPYGFRPEVPGQQTPLIEGVPARVALRSPAFYTAAAVFAMTAMLWSFTALFPSYGLSLGFTVAQASYILSFALMGAFVTKLSFGWLADRFPMQHVLLLFTGVVLASTLLLFVAGRNLLLVYIGATGFGIVQSMMSVGAPLLAKHTFGSLDYAKILTSALLAQQILGLGIPPLYGFLYDRTGSYTIALGLMVLGALVMLVAAQATVRLGKNLTFEKQYAGS